MKEKKIENHSPMHTNIGTKTKLKRADGLKFPTEQIPVNKSPSIVFVTRIIIARNAGMPQARTWKYEAKLSIDSCAHFRFAAKNQAKHNITHHTPLATLK
uniref:Uncharacterized protein n=1 Tax=Brugia timori TaxID=42155 RepID=A0A0R3QEP0_9BILA